MMATLTVKEIPLTAVSNQQLNVTLDGQNCTISVYQRDERLFLDLDVGRTPIRRGALCIPYAPVIAGSTTFKGQLYIADVLSPSTAQTTPHYSGLGDRYRLYYLTEAQCEEIDSERREL